MLYTLSITYFPNFSCLHLHTFTLVTYSVFHIVATGMCEWTKNSTSVQTFKKQVKLQFVVMVLSGTSQSSLLVRMGKSFNDTVQELLCPLRVISERHWTRCNKSLYLGFFTFIFSHLCLLDMEVIIFVL
ncbi:uncharacterized protein LOC130814038 [Amaranthus tricolor]|uniref:uncharacterized protein LOC130814038 n=1 Tax=Amaranthus tricolor TaxID=29722 RepID=UPI00258700DD|nr:uncharacterized protein LOC130814038 [Amaranthus tricolor]